MVMEGINEIYWHDSELTSVIEVPAKDQLILNVLYPSDWEAGEFLPIAIVFLGFHAAEIHEGPFAGNPTLLGASVISETGGTYRVRLETNAGYRVIFAKSVILVGSWLGPEGAETAA